jgi:hypothetical protein
MNKDNDNELQELLIDLSTGLTARGITKAPSWADTEVGKALGAIDALRDVLQDARPVILHEVLYGRYPPKVEAERILGRIDAVLGEAKT